MIRSLKQYRAFPWLLTGFLAAYFVSPAQALDPDRAMPQYIRDRWGAEQGFPGGTVYAIEGTADGYLWIGAQAGLVRFDGSTFRLFNHANSAALPAGPVLGLTTDAEGNLWIRPQSAGLVRYSAGVFHDVLPGLVPDETGVTAMCRGRNGEVLLARPNGDLRYHGGKLVPLAVTAQWSHPLVISMAETADGRVWMGTK